MNPNLYISWLEYLGPSRFQRVLPSLFALQFWMTVLMPSRETTQSGPCCRTYFVFYHLIAGDGIEPPLSRSWAWRDCLLLYPASSQKGRLHNDKVRSPSDWDSFIFIDENKPAIRFANEEVKCMRVLKRSSSAQ